MEPLTKLGDSIMTELSKHATDVWTLKSPDETRSLADRIADGLTRETCLGLIGPLGAGKTTLVKGIVDALGGDGDSVRSPTYALVQRYTETDPTVVHADLYRTEGPDQQETIGLGEHFGSALTLVEWAERWTLGWPDGTTTLLFEHVDESTRRIHRLPSAPDELEASVRESVFPSEGVLD